MPKSVQMPLPPMALNKTDGDRPSAAAEQARRQSASIELTAVVKDALIRCCGSLKAAAITLKYDQGQLTRDLQTGDFKLRKLEADQDIKEFVALAMADHYTRDPHAEARRLIREARQRLDELDTAVDRIA